MLEIYQIIKERRKQLGMTQQELAQKVGYTDRSTIAKIEAGKIDIPQSTIVSLAKALECSPSYLMGWTNNPKHNFVDDIYADTFGIPDEKSESHYDFVVFDDKDKQMIVDMMRDMHGEAIHNLMNYARYIYDMEKNKKHED